MVKESCDFADVSVVDLVLVVMATSCSGAKADAAAGLSSVGENRMVRTFVIRNFAYSQSSKLLMGRTHLRPGDASLPLYRLD